MPVVLFETDFTVASLAPLREWLANRPGTELRLLLALGYSLPDSIAELLFFRPKTAIAELAEKEFFSACDILKNKFSHIAEITCDIFTGTTQTAFDNFIRAKEVTEAVIATGHKPRHKSHRFFIISEYIRRSRLPFIEVQKQSNAKWTAPNIVADLFQ